jgi:hypothetical protein
MALPLSAGPAALRQLDAWIHRDAHSDRRVKRREITE